MKNEQLTIKVITSEIEIVTRHYTYEVTIDNRAVSEFMGDISELEGHREIYELLSQYDYKFISRVDGKQYPTDDNSLTTIDDIQILK